jgi:hypothetical protein
MIEQDHSEQIELAKNLLRTVRHAAYATTSEDGTPHNSPLMLIYNEDLTKLYIGSHSQSQHITNMSRTGRTYAVLYDSFTKNQGGVYITGINAHECLGDELVEALRVHNNVRVRQGSKPIELSYYQSQDPGQRMYCIDISKIEIYSLARGTDGLITSEARVQVTADVLL